MRNARKGFTVLLWCIAAITLLVGGISIMNIMFATIGERIREIGTRKALGARASDVFVQFIFEAILVCLAGGLPGMLMGTAITLAPEGLFPYEPELRAAASVFPMGFTVAAGVISGMFPALHAAGMEPVEALAY
jgi:putative ABC transport system permease protein